jgi:hypothetical protein
MKRLGEFNRAAEKEEDACALERTTTSSRRRRRAQLLAGEMGEEEAHTRRGPTPGPCLG